MSETIVFDPPEVTATPAGRPASNRRMQLACVWTGPVMIVGWVLAFVVLAQFIPPPSPGNSPAEVVDLYRENTNAIRLGLLITLFASALLVPFAAVITVQMQRIEGPRSVMAWTQLISAGLLSLEFIIPLMVWQTAAYRLDETSAEIVRTLNDLGWIMFVGVISSATVQFGAIGLAILSDDGSRGVFPRWAGYFNLWVAVLIVPAGVVPFFKDGPFAWDGAFAFFLPLVVFAAWIAVMTVLLRRAVISESESVPSVPVGRGATS